jgi:hypothetical protein
MNRFLKVNFLFLIFFVMTSIATAEISCKYIFIPKINLSTQNTFFIKDENNELFEFHGFLNNEGTLFIGAFLAEPLIGLRSPLQGHQLYREMIEYFGLSNIKTIQGKWVEGTNKDQFLKNIKAGLSKSQAAMETWSGQQARKYGFETNDQLVEIDKNSSTGLTSIIVQFVRK